MRVIIAGAGSIGTVVGIKLKQRYDVELIRRSGKNGYSVISIVGIENITRRIKVIDSNHELHRSKVDIIFLTAQRQQSEGILAYISTNFIVDNNTTFVCMQNGLNVSDPILSLFPAVNIVQCVVWWSATIISNEKVYYHRTADTFLGNIQGHSLELVFDMMSEHFDITLVDDIISQVRSKLIINVVSPVLALVKKPYPSGINNFIVREIIHILLDDIISIAIRQGWDIDGKVKLFHSILNSNDIISENDTTFHHKVSTQISAEKHGGKLSNAEELIGYFIHKGSEGCQLILDEIYKLKPNYIGIDISTLKTILHQLKLLSIECSRY